MEGPKVPSEARRREATERRAMSAEVGGVWRGAVALPQSEGLRAMPPENFSIINVQIAYFSAFLQAESIFCTNVRAGLDNRNIKMVQ